MIEFYRDETPVCLSDADREQAKEAIKQIHEAIAYGNMLLNEKNMDITRTNVSTIMSLISSNHARLADLFHYEDVLSAKEKLQHQEIREANLKIRALQEELGGKQSGESLSSGLMACKDKFKQWYKQAGFAFAMDVTMNVYGIQATLTEEIYSRHRTEWDTTAAEDGQLLLLDTDKNRTYIRNLLSESFPGARIIGFESTRNESVSFLLQTRIFVDYASILEWEASNNNE